MEILLVIVALLGVTSGIINKGEVKTEIIVKYETKVMVPPSDLMVSCEYTVPPDEQKYIEASWTVKEQLLFEALNDSQKKTMLCNARTTKLRDWIKEQEKIYSEKAP
jgi:hypothetical protein